jgi:hypothetical protein
MPLVRISLAFHHYESMIDAIQQKDPTALSRHLGLDWTSARHFYVVAGQMQCCRLLSFETIRFQSKIHIQNKIEIRNLGKKYLPTK